ncbi:hypothetical protein KAI32_00745 [Candidatus Pacearchaeota archaeon]|nr:hypothetical protein [Candidatus Pacearchaeota archaeon]
MTSVSLVEIEKKVLPHCNFIWNQKVTNQTSRIISICETEKDILEFFLECEKTILDLENTCKVMWNQSSTFGSDEFGYLILFYSDKLEVPIKMSIKIDTFDQTIVVGNMDIANHKDEKKLIKEVGAKDYSPVVSKIGEVSGF